MAFYQLQQSTTVPRIGVMAILALSLAYNVFIYSPWNPTQSVSSSATAIVVVFHVLFVLFVTNSRLLAPFNSRLMAKIGAASYSLYLLHESIGVSLIKRLNDQVAVSVLWPFATAAAMVGASVMLYQYVESPARRIILSGFASRFGERAEVILPQFDGHLRGGYPREQNIEHDEEEAKEVHGGVQA